MKKGILILTNNFPYGPGEEFIENEEIYWNYKRVIIIPMNQGMEMRKIKNPNIEILSYDQEFKRSLIHKIFHCLKSKEIFYEIFTLWKNKRLNLQRLRHLFGFYFNASVRFPSILRSLKKIKVQKGSEFDIYSYWLTEPAFLGSRLKKYTNGVFFSRCHRYDLYEEESKILYLPFRNYILKSLDKIYPCSVHGASYLLKKYPNYGNKIETSYLGTKDYGLNPEKRDCFLIVSCSYIVPVKQLDKLIMILSHFMEKEIKWIHIGKGSYLDEVKQLAGKYLTNKIRFEFYDKWNNEQVMTFYRKNSIQLFINTSKSEGIPVSIMEAESFGIPVIAPNVGGMKEIVNEKCGILLPKDFSILDGVKAIHHMYDLWKNHYEEYIKLRESTRAFWKSSFCAERNYPSFVKKIKKLQ